MSEPRISIYTNQSAEHTKNDGRKLFMEFMEVMRSPEADYYDGTLDIKLKKLYEDGVEYGF
tara:strand:+ start:445 stop:627 length:183 start_codon:yes stop_codon:yes gene_type:complete